MPKLTAVTYLGLFVVSLGAAEGLNDDDLDGADFEQQTMQFRQRRFLEIK